LRFKLPEGYSKEKYKDLLANAIWGGEFPRSEDGLKQLAGTLYRRGPVVLVATEMKLSDWKASGPEKVAAFFEFWKAWPPPPGRERLVVCLNIRIDRRATLEKLRYRFVKSRVFQRLDQLISDDRNLVPADRKFLIEGVQTNHAAEWRNSEHVRRVLERFVSNPDDLEDALYQIHKEAKEWWDPLPTMKRFAKKLEILVETILRARGRGRTGA
jgi:hypothetical protein